MNREVTAMVVRMGILAIVVMLVIMVITMMMVIMMAVVVVGAVVNDSGAGGGGAAFVLHWEHKMRFGSMNRQDQEYQKSDLH